MMKHIFYKNFFTIVLLLSFFVSNGQGTVTLGTGTTNNTNTAYPTPYGTYRKSMRVQYLILKSELNGLGVSTGNITALGFNIANINTIKAMPNYTLKIKSTTATVLGTTFDNDNLKQVWYSSSFLPVNGWNTHTFSSSFYWDNNSNVLVDICFDLLSTTISRNASVYYTATGTYLCTHTNSDYTPSCGTTSSSLRSYNRANMQITWSATSCPPPTSLTISNITMSTAQLGWTERGTATQWNVEVGLPGFTPGTGTYVKYVTGTGSNPWTVTGLDSLKGYEFYVRANCGGSLSQWEGPYAFQTIGSPLSGTYTIDKTQPTLNKNFNSFTDMAKALNSSTIDGPVTINVTTGTGPYTEQIILKEFTGSSATNTVTINGNGDSLQYYSTNHIELATLKLKGTDYLTVNNLVIKALATGTFEYGYAVHLMNGADYNTFDGCQFKTNTSQNSSQYAGFVACNAIADAETAGLAASNLTITHCKTIGGYHGMILNGPTSAPYSNNNNISNNTIEDFFSYGLYFRSFTNSVISENIITRPTRTNSSSLYMMIGYNDLSGTQITKNRITGFSSVSNTNYVAPIRILNAATSSGVPLQLSNNVIYGFENMNSSQEGIYINSSSASLNAKIYHNTISYDNIAQTGSGSTMAIYLQAVSGAQIDLRNNIISITNTSAGNKYCYYFNGAFTLTCNNNVLYNNNNSGTNYTAYWNSTSFNSFASWQAYNSNAYDQNSKDIDPQFTSPLVTPRRYLIDNMGADLSAQITDDIFGVSRPAASDPGAIEFTGLPCIPPASLTASGITDDAATLIWSESGSATLWNAEIGVDGFTPGNDEEVASTIGATSTSWNVSGLDVLTDYEFYVQSDCGSGDVSTWAGPYAFSTLATLLSGTYTINSTQPTGGTNFISFTDLAGALTSGGLAGPVTVNVVTGTGPYNESFLLNELNFSSATNTLTINGNNETLQYLSTNNYQRATLKLNGTDYVTVNNLTIKALGTNSNEYGFAAHVKSAANFNAFNNCQFITNITSDLNNYAAFVMNDNDTSATSWAQTTVANNLSVTNSSCTGGYIGMAICGAAIDKTPADNISISNNEIKDFYLRGLAVIGVSNSLIEGNTITRPERTNGGGIEMMYLASYMNGTTISKNVITEFSIIPTTNSAYGITSSQLIASSGGGLLIANNLIYGFQNMNGGQTGIQLNTYSSSDIFKLYHNTVALDNTSHGGAFGIFCLNYSGSNDNLEIKNNIFSYTTNTTGAKYIYYFGVSSGFTLTSNNNVLHMGYILGTTRCAYKFPTNYTALADWQAAGYDVNGTGSDPAFINPLRTPTNSAVANIGYNLLSIVPDDISGASRTSTPDPGVLEFVPQTCLQPSIITLNSFSAESAIFDWTEQGTAVLWNTEVGLIGFTPGTGTSVVSQSGVSTKPWTATGLSSNTGYHFYVRSDCGGGDLSPWIGPYTFRTLCNNVTTFSEDFDDVTAPALSDCWVKAGGIGGVYTITAASTSAPNSLALNSSPSSHGIVIMPPVSNAGAGTHFLRFKARVTAYPGTAELQLGYITNPNDRSTFVLLESMTLTTSFYEYEFYPGTAPGSNNYLALRADPNYGNVFYIDDIRWIPDNCPQPTNQSLTNLSATTATMSWTEIGSATVWDTEVGLSGYLPGAGNHVATGSDVTSNSWQATGLSSNTSYDFYVRADCGSNYSTWTGPFSFTTPCTTSNLPLAEYIDNASFPACWQPSVTGIWSANNSANAGGEAYELRALFKSYNGISRLVAPPVNTSGLSKIKLRFLTSLTGNTTGAILKIQSSADGVNWTDEGWSKTSNSFVSGGTEVDIDISNNLGANTYIAWVIDGNHMAYNNWRVDNIRITSCWQCSNLSASNITTTAADLTWNAGSNETQWNIEWGTAGFTFGTGTRVTGHNSTTYNLSGLSLNTSYDFYVQADCINDTSSWAGPFTFKTECNPVSSLPWTEGFETTVIPSLSPCWTEESGDWVVTNNANTTYDADAYAGSQFLREAWNASNEYVWTPGFELTAGTSYDLSFWWAGDNYPGWTGEVYCNTSHSSSGATALGAAFVETGTTTDKTYRKVIRTFTPSVNGVYHFALKINATHPDAWYISFDDFLLEVAPPCGTPSGVSASNISATTADLSWTAGSNQTLWDVELGTSGFTPGTGTSLFSATGISNPNWQATSLTPNTAYDFYVRAQCTGGGYSYWPDKLSFSTACGTFYLPYEDGFENNVCWTQVDVDGSGAHWGISSSTNHTSGGAKSAYHNYGASGYAETGMLYSPFIVFPSGVNIEMSFWSYNSLPLSYGKNSLLISTDGTNFTEVWSPVSVVENWTETTVDLSAYAGNTIKLAFKYEGTFAHRWYVDDVKIVKNLIVDAASQVINSSTSFENITIEPTGQLSLNNGNTLNVTGNFIIESDENGTGSFIQNGNMNVTGDIVVQKYLPNNTTSGWTLSVPVVNADESVFAGADGLFYYNSSTRTWMPHTAGALAQMTGYVVRFPITKTILFNGSLNNGSFSRTDLVRTVAPSNYGWNYVGNPYPSPIDWNATPGISFTNLNSAIYFRKANGDVASYVDGLGNNGGTNIIPSMQAFWVQVTEGQSSGTLAISNEARVHGANANYKSTIADVLRINLSVNGLSDEAVVRFRNNATPGFDGAFDAEKMYSDNLETPQIYSQSLYKEYAINSLPEITGCVTVPLGFNAPYAGSYVISFAGLDNFDSHVSIVLDDLFNNSLTNLRQQPSYTFNEVAGCINDRFVLHFNSNLLNNDMGVSDKSIQIYAYENAVYINNIKEKGAVVYIYNTLGQSVVTQNVFAGCLNKVNTQLKTGNYYVKVITPTGINSSKVFLKQK